MRHAFLILAHKNIDVINKLIASLNDDKFYLFIHIDIKSKIDFNCLFKKHKNNKHIFFIKRQKCKWGSFDAVRVIINLLEISSKQNFDYYHIISGDTLPIKSNEIIKRFYFRNKGYCFIDLSKNIKDMKWRLCKYHVFCDYNRQKNWIKTKLYRLINIIFKLLPRKDPKEGVSYFHKGSEWCDLTHEFALYILMHKDWIYKTFKYTCCSDEIFIPTLLLNSQYKNRIKNGSMYVDWDNLFSQENTTPSVLNIKYFSILKNTDKLFARKFEHDYNFVDKLMK